MIDQPVRECLLSGELERGRDRLLLAGSGDSYGEALSNIATRDGSYTLRGSVCSSLP